MAGEPLPSADRSAERSPASQAITPAAGYEEGDLHCERGCPNRTAVQCAYVDRHGRRCLSAWCPQHRTVLNGVAYCRRHAGILAALDHPGPGTPLPDLDNRAPSLVNWIGNEIDADMRALLERIKEGPEAVHHSPVGLELPQSRRGRRWSRSWSLVGGDVETVRVAIEVDERHDPEIAVRVGHDVVVRSIAPWIGHRLRGEWVPADVDQTERRNFSRDLCDLIESTVTRDRDGTGGVQRPSVNEDAQADRG